MDKFKGMARWVLLIGSILLGLFYLNAAFYSWWAAWGPPTDYPKAWEQQAVARLCISIAIFFTGPMLFMALRRGFDYKKSVFKYVWLLVVVVCVAYPNGRELLAIDKCLDSGVEWSQDYFDCKYEYGPLWVGYCLMDCASYTLTSDRC